MDGTLQHSGDLAAASPRLQLRLPAWKRDERAGKKPEGEWHDLPTGFVAAIKTAADFADHHPSAGAFNGVLLDGCCAYATDNTVIVEVEASGAVPSTVIPLALAEMLVRRQQPPVTMLVQEGLVAFAWADGTWIRFASRHSVRPVVPAEFAKWVAPEWQIPASWKQQFRAAAAMGGETIVIAPDAISTGFGVSAMFCEAETPVADETIWGRTVLASVIKLAERIDFTSHPKGACFAFDGGRGLIAARV